MINVDFLLVADAAQSFGGKVFMLGGGWTHIALSDDGSAPRFSVVAGIRIPWSETNRPFRVAIELRDADGELVEELLPERVFEQGRPPGLRPGSAQRLSLAVPAEPNFPWPGSYVLTAKINDLECARTVIEAVLLRGDAS